MNEFKASNGVRIQRHPDRISIVDDTDGVASSLLGFNRYQISGFLADALREFFLHERDEQLGRWRWPENPDYVVYPQGLDSRGFRYAMAVYEPLGTAGKWQEGQSVTPPITDPAHLGMYAVAAYFDAHPEPKPWHDAKPGEVWDLDLLNGGNRYIVYYSAAHDEPTPVFRDPYTQVEYETDDATIRDGHRIYPEPAS